MDRADQLLQLAGAGLDDFIHLFDLTMDGVVRGFNILLALTAKRHLGTLCAVPKEPRSTLLSIQYLRGLAALIVVTAHMPWYQADVGAAGVDIFFIISGFIMANISRRETTLLAFMTARILRIMPLYWTITVVELVVGNDQSLKRLMASFLFIPTLDVGGWYMPIVGQGWTLTYEMFFYFLFGITLWLSPAWRLRSLTMAFVAFYIAQAGADESAFVTRGISAAPLLEFLLGIALHQTWMVGRIPRTKLCTTAAAAGLMIILYTWKEASPPLRVILWGIPALLIVTAGLAMEATGRLPKSRALLVLGDASFALYLTHPLVQRFLKPFVEWLPLPLALTVIFSGCVLVGIATHFWIEQPMAVWLGRRVRGIDRNRTDRVLADR